MRTRACLPLAFFLLAGPAPEARSADAPPPATGAVREMQIDPGTTGIPLGHARLSVGPLTHAPGQAGLSAAYKVEISPWSFKSEAGRFSVAISDADLRRLADGTTIHFTGQAVSQDGGNTSAVQGRAAPVAHSDGGALRIQVDGDKGKLVFHTTYHLQRFPK